MVSSATAILGGMSKAADAPTTHDHDVPLYEIEAAAARLAGNVHRTPLFGSVTAAAWAGHAAGIRLADDRLYLKAEHLQKTGSFKARGMTNRIVTLSEEARARGAITLSAGNAGQAYAWAGAGWQPPSRVASLMPASSGWSRSDPMLCRSPWSAVRS